MNKSSITNYIKLALVPILGGVLGYLVFGRTAKGSRAEPEPIPSATMATVRLDVKSTAKPEPHQPEIETVWPTFDRAVLDTVDPFDRRSIFPEQTPKAAVAESEPSTGSSLVSMTSAFAARQLARVKIQAVFQTPEGAMAMVNDQVVRIGDELSDGSQVVGIAPDHLTVALPSVH